MKLKTYFHGTTLLGTTVAASLILLATDVALSSPPDLTSLTNGLLLHLPFDNGSYADISGNHNNASPVGSVTFVYDVLLSGGPGPIPLPPSMGALHVSASSSGRNYVTLGANRPTLQLGTNNFTVSYWVRTSDDVESLPVFSDAINAYSAGFTFGFDANNHALAGFATGTKSSIPTGEWPLNDGNWHQVAAVVDRNNNVTLFVDGIVTGLQPCGYAAGLTIDNSLPVNIGQNANGTILPASGTNAMDIDDLALWGRALSTNEVQAIYLTGVGGNSFQTVTPPPPTYLLTNPASDGYPRRHHLVRGRQFRLRLPRVITLSQPIPRARFSSACFGRRHRAAHFPGQPAIFLSFQ